MKSKIDIKKYLKNLNIPPPFLPGSFPMNQKSNHTTTLPRDAKKSHEGASPAGTRHTFMALISLLFYVNARPGLRARFDCWILSASFHPEIPDGALISKRPIQCQ